MEVTIEFAARAGKAALMQVTPYGRERNDHVDILEMVVDNQSQVLVHRIDSHAVQVWQHVIVYSQGLLAGESMEIERLCLFFVEALHGNHQHISVKHHPDTLGRIHQQFAGLESLAQVGSHRYAAFHHVGFKHHIRSVVRGL